MPNPSFSLLSAPADPAFLTYRAGAGDDRKQKSVRLLKRGIWAYFILLLFEGALRKWFLPGLAAPLLIVRDPIALWLVIVASTSRIGWSNGYWVSLLVITILGIFATILTGHGNWPVALFGARIFLLHFPLIFIIGRVFDVDDVLQVGRVMLWLALPMTLLIMAQFYSPQSAWVNQGVGADQAGAGFSGALGYFRPPGTFSFINGTAAFYAFLACFVFYAWLVPRTVNRWLLLGAAVSLLAAIPFSISRSLFFHVCVSACFTAFVAIRKSKPTGQLLLTALGGLVVLFGLSQITLIQTSINAFLSRFESANEQEGGLEGVFLDRFLGGMLKAVTESTDLPFFGYGLGLGTNVGAQLIAGERTFLVAEEEWGRTIGELGLLLGLGVILVRVILTANLAITSYQQLRRNNLLPWQLLSIVIILLPQGGWAQPTALGFSVFISGLLIAALRQPKVKL